MTKGQNLFGCKKTSKWINPENVLLFLIVLKNTIEQIKLTSTNNLVII